MLVIVEGPDGSGKTTLCNTLRDELTSHTWFLRSNGPPRSVIDLAKTLDWITRAVPPRINLVCDRLNLISEMVYGPILRGKCMHEFDARLIAQYLLSAPIPSMVIYCRPNLTVLETSSTVKKQKEGVTDSYLSILQAYDELMCDLVKYEVSVLTYDFSQPQHLDVPTTIQRFFDGQARSL